MQCCMDGQRGAFVMFGPGRLDTSRSIIVEEVIAEVKLQGRQNGIACNLVYVLALSFSSSSSRPGSSDLSIIASIRE